MPAQNQRYVPPWRGTVGDKPANGADDGWTPHHKALSAKRGRWWGTGGKHEKKALTMIRVS